MSPKKNPKTRPYSNKTSRTEIVSQETTSRFNPNKLNGSQQIVFQASRIIGDNRTRQIRKLLPEPNDTCAALLYGAHHEMAQQLRMWMTANNVTREQALAVWSAAFNITPDQLTDHDRDLQEPDHRRDTITKLLQNTHPTEDPQRTAQRIIDTLNTPGMQRTPTRYTRHTPPPGARNTPDLAHTASTAALLTAYLASDMHTHTSLLEALAVPAQDLEPDIALLLTATTHAYKATAALLAACYRTLTHPDQATPRDLLTQNAPPVTHRFPNDAELLMKDDAFLDAVAHVHGLDLPAVRLGRALADLATETPNPQRATQDTGDHQTYGFTMSLLATTLYLVGLAQNLPRDEERGTLQRTGQADAWGIPTDPHFADILNHATDDIVDRWLETGRHAVHNRANTLPGFTHAPYPTPSTPSVPGDLRHDVTCALDHFTHDPDMVQAVSRIAADATQRDNLTPHDAPATTTLGTALANLVTERRTALTDTPAPWTHPHHDTPPPGTAPGTDPEVTVSGWRIGCPDTDTVRDLVLDHAANYMAALFGILDGVMTDPAAATAVDPDNLAAVHRFYEEHLDPDTGRITATTLHARIATVTAIGERILWGFRASQELTGDLTGTDVADHRVMDAWADSWCDFLRDYLWTDFGLTV